MEGKVIIHFNRTNSNGLSELTVQYKKKKAAEMQGDRSEDDYEIQTDLSQISGRQKEKNN